jgi:hypothetical protein
MIKRTNEALITLCLLLLLLTPLPCFCDGVDGVFWNKMDKIQKSLFVMGYKMGSLDAIMTLNAFIDLNDQAARERKSQDDPKSEQISRISDAHCADLMDITRKGVIRETYVPEEDLEKIVAELDTFYSSKQSLKVGISDAISKIREEMYRRNANIEKALKTRKQLNKLR